MRGPGMGVKKIEKRVRNRRFKIRRMMEQPKNIDVKKRNGRVVCKMVVRRHITYPAEVRGTHY